MNATDHLEALARDLIGDGKSPNVYIVTDGGTVTTITTDRRLAYLSWRLLAVRGGTVACTLEDREHGLLATLGEGDGWDHYAQLTGDPGLDPEQVLHLIEYANEQQRQWRRTYGHQDRS